MKKYANRVLAMVLALMMILPMISIPTFAASANTYFTQDFESFAAGKTLATSDGFAAVAPFNKVLADENGNKFLRLPFIVTATDSTYKKTEPTNAGKWMQFNHAAFSTTELTSVSVDIRLNGISGTNPYAGLWLRNVGYTNTSGTQTTETWFQFFNVNLLTGALVLPSKYSPSIVSGAKGLNVDGWNTVETIFNPADGSFSVYVNDALYANCKSNVTGTNFTVAANRLMFAIDGANNVNCFTTPGKVDEDYSNCNSMDADNFVIKKAEPKPISNVDCEDYAVGTTLTSATGWTSVAPFNKVLEEDGNKFIRLPIASTQAGSANNVKVKPTNSGGIFRLQHTAFSTTEATSISMDMRIHGVSGSNTPNIGVWISDLYYTNTSGVSTKQKWYRLFDFNLLTGEVTGKDVKGTKTGAKGLLPDVWNHVEVVFDPLSGAFDIYVNNALYMQCDAFVEGTNFVIGANKVIWAVCSGNNYVNYKAVADLNDTYSNCNYMDGDNFKIVTTEKTLSGKLFYQENFNSYTAGGKVTVGSSQNVNSTYEQDPTNANNVVVKVPFAPAPNPAEILMRVSGNLPLEHKPTDATAPQIGYFEVTRNAETNAVEVAGYTVTEESDGTYKVTNGTDTYTGLKLTTKEDYYGYWGGDGAIDQNWQLPNPEINYTKQPSVVFSVDYYISNDAYGKILAQMRNYASNGASAQWLDLFYIDAGAGTIQPKGASAYKCINKGEWNNVMIEFDLVAGTGKVYVNGTYVGDGTYAANLTLTSGRLMVAKINRKAGNYQNYEGYFMVDNVKLMSSSNVITVDADRLLYVEVDGRKIYNNTFNLPAGATYKAVYLKDADYATLLTTEQKNSIRLATESGLRFATKLDMTLLAQLYALVDSGELADVQLGTLIAPTDYVTGEFTVAALDSAKKTYLAVDATRDAYFSFDADDSTTHFVGSIVNFYESNISRAFSGRGYAKITFRSGQEIMLYSALTQSASVKDVAARVLEQTDYVNQLTTEQKAILDTYAEGKAPAVPEDVTRERKLDGLNVLAFGDSLFHGDATGYPDQWLALMARRHNWNLTNLGRNGWCIGDATHISSKGSIYKKLMTDSTFCYGTTSTAYYQTGNAKDLTFEDVDVIFLEGGNNDCGARLPFGEIDSDNPQTLMGGMNLVIDYLLETYPNAKLVLVTSWYFDSVATENGMRFSHMDYAVNSMKMLYNARFANDPRVTIIDFGDPALSNVHMDDAAWRAQYSCKPGDKYHLNAEGMKIAAAAMEKLLPDALFVCDGKDGISVQHDLVNGVCKDCEYVDPLSVKDEDVTRVVCVGDSITANGYWKNNMMGNLDESFEVIGLGVSGSTGLVAGTDQTIPKAYVNQDNYQLSLRQNADVVVIMLGTNDSKPENCDSIKADNGAQYTKDMIAMVNAYKAACPDAQIYLALPATVYDGSRFGGISEANVTEIIIPCLEAVAEATGAILVDVHTATANAGDHFTDGVHPSDDTGRGLIAKAISDAILENRE